MSWKLMIFFKSLEEESLNVKFITQVMNPTQQINDHLERIPHNRLSEGAHA